MYQITHHHKHDPQYLSIDYVSFDRVCYTEYSIWTHPTNPKRLVLMYSSYPPTGVGSDSPLFSLNRKRFITQGWRFLEHAHTLHVATTTGQLTISGDHSDVELMAPCGSAITLETEEFMWLLDALAFDLPPAPYDEEK